MCLKICLSNESAVAFLVPASTAPSAAVAAAANSVAESLEESAAAYTKATAKKCILEKVEVRTGEESESNVLQVGFLFPFTVAWFHPFFPSLLHNCNQNYDILKKYYYFIHLLILMS